MASDNKTQYILVQENDILMLKRNTNEKVFVDFLTGEFRQRLKTISKSQPLFKALAIEKGDKVLDATAGMGKDAVCFCYLGAKVTAVEQNETVFRLLEDGIRRAKLESSFEEVLSRLNIVCANSIEYMKNLAEKPDSVYLDPMYPVSEKSAKPKKEMAFLRELLKPTENIEEMLDTALRSATKRVVIKRPLGSPVLGKPHHSFESKMVRFDMYLMNHRIM